MILPKEITVYADSDVQPEKSRHDVEWMIEKNGVKMHLWKRENPENSYLVFKLTENNQDLVFKVSVPYIQKRDGTYDERRSYRFFYHIFKSMLLNSQIGMTMKEVFSSYLVVGQLADGTPQNMMDKVQEMIGTGNVPQLSSSVFS